MVSRKPAKEGLSSIIYRELTNCLFSPVNPVYTPTMVLSLTQPLLQNFGWRFATINVRLVESAQRLSQL